MWGWGTRLIKPQPPLSHNLTPLFAEGVRGGALWLAQPHFLALWDQIIDEPLMGFSYPFQKKDLWSSSMKGSLVFCNGQGHLLLTEVWVGGQQLDIDSERGGVKKKAYSPAWRPDYRSEEALVLRPRKSWSSGTSSPWA